MPNHEHLQLLQEGPDAWNHWRKSHASHRKIDLSNTDLFQAILPLVDLSNADLSDTNLSGANLNGANLRGANLSRAALSAKLRRALMMHANLSGADLSNADLTGANLSYADLSNTDLRGANLSQAKISGAIFTEADLRGTSLTGAKLRGARFRDADLRQADLREADLTGVNLQAADLSDADLTGANLQAADLTEATLIRTCLRSTKLDRCRVFGISAWKLDTYGAIQSNLIISDSNEPVITVDNLEIAQFLYMLINSQKIREVIDTIGKKSVLILGRFTDERKVVLDALREELRKRDYIPILFDFDKPRSRDLTETISTLAHLSRFIIADVTDAKSIPQELKTIVPNLPSVAVYPIIQAGEPEYAMFEHFKRFPWVLPVFEYQSQPALLAALSDIVGEAEAKVEEIRP